MVSYLLGVSDRSCCSCSPIFAAEDPSCLGGNDRINCDGFDDGCGNCCADRRLGSASCERWSRCDWCWHGDSGAREGRQRGSQRTLRMDSTGARHTRWVVVRSRKGIRVRKRVSESGSYGIYSVSSCCCWRLLENEGLAVEDCRRYSLTAAPGYVIDSNSRDLWHETADNLIQSGASISLVSLGRICFDRYCGCDSPYFGRAPTDGKVLQMKLTDNLRSIAA